MLALSVRQPYVEQVLRGIKRYEYRSVPTRMRKRVYLYASLQPGDPADFRRLGKNPGDLPSGVLVGTVEITGCSRNPHGGYRWHLSAPRRLSRARRPAAHPQPMFFYPFP